MGSARTSAARTLLLGATWPAASRPSTRRTSTAPTTRRTSRSRTARRWACRPCPLNLVYTDEEGYVTAEEAKEKELSALKLSGTKFRKMLRGGEDIPEWFAFKSVVEVLRQNA